MRGRIADLPRAFGQLPRWSRVVLTAAGIVALGLTAAVGGAPATVAFLVFIGIATAVAVAASDRDDRPIVLTAVLLAFVVRALIASLLEGYLQLRAPGSVFAPDESLYISTARRLAEHLADPAAPFDASSPYLKVAHVQLMAVLFWAIGPNVLVVKLMNSFFGVVAPVLLFRAMRNLGLPGARLATVAVLFFPSLLFWSTLALKDAYVELVLLAAIWTSSEFIRSRHYRWILATAVPLIALESVRRYGYFAIALAFLAVPLALPTWRERAKAAAAIGATVAILFAIFDPLSDAGPNPLYLPIVSRGAAAAGARSAFVEPLPVVRGDAGDRFVVTVPDRTAPPDVTPRVVVVAAGTEIVVEGSSSHGTGPSVVVRPGDILVIAGAAAESPPPAAPGRTPEVAVLKPDAKSMVGPASIVDPDATSASGSLITNVRNLPIGMLYVAFAPFPWAARSLLELATIPEMLFWYLSLPLSIAGALSLIRRRDLGFVHGAVFAAGMFVALSLIAANTGTLIRSRAMLIPFVVALAAVAAAPLLRERLPKKLRWVAA